MNRRNFFKGIAALPLAVAAPKAIAAPVVPPPSGLFGGIDLSGVFASGTPFVPRDCVMYLHRGEPGMQIVNNFVLNPTEEQRQTIRDIALARKQRSH